MPVIVGVALGGALGSAGRYALDRLIEHRSDASTFAQESLDLVDARDLVEATFYIAGSIVLGMVAVSAGRSLGRSF